MLLIISLIIAYCLGSIPTAMVLSKYLKLPDPTQHGSNNPGATNILRLAGKKEALMVLIGDALKGLIAVWIADISGVMGFSLALVAFVAVVGHVFPAFNKFKGGKGVATALGTYLGLSFPLGIVAIIIWVAVAAVLRMSSLAALAACVLTPFLALFLGHASYFVPLLLTAALIVWRHKANIERLRAGTEEKINLFGGSKKAAHSAAQEAPVADESASDNVERPHVSDNTPPPATDSSNEEENH